VEHLHLSGTGIPDARELQRIFDEGLPSDVAVRSVTTCSPAFHARHDALERTYLYQLSTRRSALAKPFIWWVKGRVEVPRLREAWMAFQGSYDASAFADLEPGEDPRVHITTCEFEADGSLILLRATADHFLRRQVRRMVGAAVLCAMGREKTAHILRDLQQPTPEANLHWSGKAAPAAGLFLESVRYASDGPRLALRAIVQVP
jgi:tRNA pseudouridine38-40 synthase